jgi:hypothetical protein
MRNFRERPKGAPECSSRGCIDALKNSSLSFHLGLSTPQPCVDFLVNSVGHEADNLAAEVRGSFNGSVPLRYPCAYMLGPAIPGVT